MSTAEKTDEPVLVAPPVEVPMRPAAEDEIPRGARDVLRRLYPGWTTRALYARGPVLRTRREGGEKVTTTKVVDGVEKRRTRTIGATQVKRYEIADSIAVRFAYPNGVRAVGVWLDGQFELAAAWIDCRRPNCTRTQPHTGTVPRMINATALAALVADEPTIEGD